LLAPGVGKSSFSARQGSHAMPEIEDRTTRPRGVIPRTMWVTLAVLGAVMAAPFISVYIMSHSVHEKKFSMRQGIQVPSDKEVYSVVDSLQAQTQARRQQTQPQQQIMAAPMVISAAPVSSAKQEDPALEEYRRHKIEERLSAPMAPIFGDPTSPPV